MELLIVIVVIAILAAITIVGYNGITNKARASAAAAAAGQVANKLAVYQTDNGAYPTQLSDANINDTSSTTYQYSVNNSASPQTYCVTATVGNQSAFVSDSQTAPTSGGCPGHGVGGVGAVTNLSQNPSIESGTSTYSSYIGGSISRSTSVPAFNGTGSLAVQPAANQSNSGFTESVPGLVSGKTYTYSFYIYRTSSAETLNYFIDGVGANGISVPQNTWTRLSKTFTYSSYGNWGVRQVTATSSPAPFYIDGVTYVEGSSAPASYVDGNSPNWVWNGSANNSTSTGPGS